MVTNTNILKLRDKLPICILFCRSSAEFKILFNSLRFSTHCLYFFVCSENVSIDNNYIYCKSFCFNDDFDKSILTNEYFLLFIHNQKIHYINGSRIDIKSDSLNNFADFFTFIKSTLISNSKIENIINNDLSTIRSIIDIILARKVTIKLNKIVLPIFVDFTGALVFLGIILYYKNGTIDVLDSQTINQIDDINLSHLKIKNTLFSLGISFYENDINFYVLKNYYNCYEFEILRSVGINIPLIFVQNFYERVISPIQFVPSKFINFNSFKIKYNCSLIKTLYVDLDETLIWSATGICIDEILNFLYKLKSIANISIKLITRHNKLISESLKIADIDYKIFNEVICVVADEKKSNYISKNSLFIDNDFSERIDAFKNSSAISLNLDQIDFFNI